LSAKKHGLNVPDIKLVKVGSANVLLSKRFDRTNSQARIGYLSALSLFVCNKVFLYKMST
jgi:hypothetical protein